MVKKSKKKSKAPIFILVGIVVIIALFFLFSGSKSNVNAESLAQCMTDNGVKMYGSLTCSVCARERKLFGDSFHFVNEIECHPDGENPQTQLCLDKEIEHTPTWVLEDSNGNEIKRESGFKTFKELAEFSGCELEENE